MKHVEVFFAVHWVFWVMDGIDVEVTHDDNGMMVVQRNLGDEIGDLVM